MIERPQYMTDEQWKGAEEWINSRPPAVRAVVEHRPPWGKYRLKETGQVGMIYSYEENDNGTVTVKFNTEMDEFTRLPIQVFGVDPESLERIDQ
jgi:hypothetical protein